MARKSRRGIERISAWLREIAEERWEYGNGRSLAADALVAADALDSLAGLRTENELLRGGLDVERHERAEAEDVLDRLREAAGDVIQRADGGIEVAVLSEDEMGWLCPKCGSRDECLPGCKLTPLLRAIDRLAAELERP